MFSAPWMKPTATFIAACLLGLAVPLITQDQYRLDVAMRIVQALTLVMGLHLILSVGKLNLAHISFVGIGAYASAVFTAKLGLSFWLALPLSGAIAAVIAAFIGAITLRLSGPYFFLVTYAFLNIVVLFFQGFFTGTFGGASGFTGIPHPDPIHLLGLTLRFDTKLQLFYLAMALLIVLGGLTLRLDQSRFALACRGIRQTERVAASVGINPFRYKLQAFVFASFVAGAIGSFFAGASTVIHYSDFGIDAMLRLVVFVVAGGVGSMAQTIVKVIVLSLVMEYLRGFHSFETIIYGGILLGSMLVNPGLLRACLKAVGIHRLKVGAAR